MKLAIMQPYFFPYIGYWQLINAVDSFVIYDDVNFIKGGWVNRNRILVNKQEHMLTLELKKSSPNKLINQLEISSSRARLVKTISMSYKQAPHFSTSMPLIEEIMSSQASNLALFLEQAIRKLCYYMGIQTTILVSSHIEKNNELRAQEKILNICKKLKADLYINAIGGQELYDSSAFKVQGIDLAFIQPLPLEYKQFSNAFLPWLSIIDVIMFNSLGTIQYKLAQYKLVNP